MEINDKVRTPRFSTVRISEVFGSRQEAYEAGYTEPTGYKDGGYGVAGMSLDEYHMKFAAYRAG